MTAQRTACQPLIAFAGRTLPEQWAQTLLEAVTDSTAGLPSEATLRFRDPHHRLTQSLGVRIGSPVTMAATTNVDSGPVPLFDGEVTALETTVDTLGTCTVVRAMDRAHRLMRGRTITSYTDQTLPAIAGQAARRAGLRLGTVAGQHPPLPYLAQPNLSDWELLQSLTGPRDLLVCVDGETLHLRRINDAADAPQPEVGSAGSPYVLEHGANLLSLQARLTSAGQVSDVTVHGWNPLAKKALSATSQATSSPRIRSGARGSDVVSAFRATTGLHVTDRSPTTDADTRATAAAIAAECAATLADIDAVVSGNPHLRANTPIALAGVGAPFTGKYTLTSCRHIVDTDGYRTHVRVGPLPRPPVPPNAPALIATGLATAIVADCKEPGNPGQGRVRLRLPWLSDTYITDWTRTTQHGGTKGGGIITPDVGDEVLIGFEHGRLDRPYILGGLYNPTDRPGPHTGPLVDPRSGHVNRRSLASRAGDRIELLDSTGRKGVVVTTGDGKATLTLDRAATTVTVASDGTITLRAGKKLILQAPQVDIN
ncbi:VgrG-related protein [Nocardia terpenica]|uniref:VgrG-related protein n=1 Tax=Nocardia terpenica TaxID=455432 RepID=UPI00142D1C7D|nr:VgrG-related protein [Nocardia terpenica]